YTLNLLHGEIPILLILQFLKNLIFQCPIILFRYFFTQYILSCQFGPSHQVIPALASERHLTPPLRKHASPPHPLAPPPPTSHQPPTHTPTPPAPTPPPPP